MKSLVLCLAALSGPASAISGPRAQHKDSAQSSGGFLSLSEDAVAEALRARAMGGGVNWLYVGLAVAAVLIVAIAAVVVVLKRRAAAAAKKPQPDTTVTLAPYTTVPADKLEEVRAKFQGFYDSVEAEDEGLLFYGFTVDEASCRVSCRETYASAAGLKKHSKNIEDRLQELSAIAPPFSGTVHGPKKELETLRDTLGPLGFRLFATAPENRLHCIRPPKVWGMGFTDHHLVMVRSFSAPGKTVELMALLTDFYSNINQEQFGLLYYGCSVDEENGVVMTREGFARGRTAITFLTMIDATLKQAAELSELTSVEVHGPQDEISRLAEPLAPLPCTFFVLDDGATAWVDGVEFDVADIKMSKLLADSGSKMVEQFQQKIESGSRTRQLIEARASCFQDKAKDFVIKSMNDMSKDLLKAIDAEEAGTVIEFNKLVETSFPPVTVVLAGILSPLVLSMSYSGHLIQLVALFVPVLILTTWSIIEDFGTACDIPTMRLWIWVAFAVSLIQVLGHGYLFAQTAVGQKRLKAKTAEISERLAANAADGETSMSDVQDFFIGSTILVQEALIIEDTLRKSPFVDAVGVSNLLWVVAVIWNFVVVVGWTFVPGTIAFHEKAAAVAAGDYCGAWATVFTARIVCLLTPLFFFLNIFSAVQWIVSKLMHSSFVSRSILGAAANVDKGSAGIPVAQTLVKAFLLRASHDASRARLMVALGEKLRLSKERDDVRGELMAVKRRIDASKLERKLLKQMIKEQGDSMEDNIKLLEKAGAEDTAQWKSLGAEMAKKAESRAAAGQKVATDQLDKVVEYVTQLAEQVQNSEAFKAALEKTREAAREAQALAAQAQETATEGMSQAQQKVQAGIEYAQSDEARAAVEHAKEMAQQAVDAGAAHASAAAAYAQSDEAKAALAQARDAAMSKASEAAAYVQSDEAKAAVQAGVAKATEAASQAQKAAQDKLQK